MRLDLDPGDIDELAEAVATRVLQRLAEVVVPEPTATPSTWLTTTEAAKYLGLGKSTLEQWRMRGEGPPAHRAMGRVRYARADLDTWQRGQS